MIRVFVICEGQTEESFVNDVLAPHLWTFGVYLFPRLIGTRGHQGGNVKFERVLVDIKNLVLGDNAAYCTTLFDYYGIHSDFPGRADANAGWLPERKYTHFCTSFGRKVADALGQDAARRFIPYVQMYEFEGLLFSCPVSFAAGMGDPTLSTPLQAIRNAFATPEHINDSVLTAPSKRISQIMRGYQKPLHGISAALEIGLPDIRQECGLFDQWVSELEALGP